MLKHLSIYTIINIFAAIVQFIFICILIASEVNPALFNFRDLFIYQGLFLCCTFLLSIIPYIIFIIIIKLNKITSPVIYSLFGFLAVLPVIVFIYTRIKIFNPYGIHLVCFYTLLGAVCGYLYNKLEKIFDQHKLSGNNSKGK